ncbi:ATP-dependent zinc metalloprotease FtsH [Bremerella volcania]|uniref:ATP-dependent zinc metalloprotease FtsH n=1 Tax=Bremerella volcania TaxID=2527984 RepID=A0A518CE00_9BACT|nr:hypothetical protein [Bremerella volcania]QDU77448.1 ATP-dependent zinc metalloprotease FtsH [Bremerella volcania]
MEEINAYHEAGHALLAIVVGARVRHVSLIPEWDDGADRFAEIQVEWPIDQFTTRELHQKMIMVALAGPVAEMIHTGEPYHPGFIGEWASDWQAAWQSAERFISDRQKRMSFLEKATNDLYSLLSQDHYWAALAAIVDELVAHETLDGEQVEQTVQTWL